MGTPDFAVPSLKKMIEEHEVLAVLTQPDKPKGRGNKLSMSPIKELALQHGIPVYQPLKLRNDEELISRLHMLQPDYIIVVAFGQILTKVVLDIPKYACINVHGSILPKYRGAAPINWAVINGEKYSGTTTMLMDVGIDTGDMLLKSQVEITENMTAGELHDILMIDGAELLSKTIKEFTENKIIPEKQNDADSCYASMLDKQMASIDWNNTAEKIKNLIRGLNPWPIAYTSYKNETMKIYYADAVKAEVIAEPGKILAADKEGIDVATGSGIIRIKKLQFPGGKPLTAEEYLRGNKIEIGTTLQ